MSTALAHHPGMRALADKSKHDLMRHVMNIRSGLQKHKAHAKHVGTVVVGSVLASAGGATGGVLALKFPHVPKTKIRTDFVLGTVVAAAVAVGALEELSGPAAAFSQGLLGFATGDVARAQLIKMGWKQAA